MLVIILVVVLALLAAGGLVTWKLRAAACSRRVGAPDGERERTFFGGVLCKAVTTSGPLVRLELLDWGIRLRGTVWSRWIVPTWEARYEELAIAELVASPFSRIGVWFRLRGAADGMGFLSANNEDILRFLETRDVPVNRSVARFRKVAELYQAR